MTRWAGHNLTLKKYSPTVPKEEELSRSTLVTRVCQGREKSRQPADLQGRSEMKLGSKVKVKTRSNCQDPAGRLWHDYVTSCTSRTADQTSQHGELFPHHQYVAESHSMWIFLIRFCRLLCCCSKFSSICLWLLKRMHLHSTESSFFSRPLLGLSSISLPDWCHLQVQSQYSKFYYPGHWRRIMKKNVSGPKTLPVNFFFPTLNQYHLLLFFLPVSYMSFSGSFTETVYSWFSHENSDAVMILPTSPLSRGFTTAWEQKLQWFTHFDLGKSLLPSNWLSSFCQFLTLINSSYLHFL